MKVLILTIDSYSLKQIFIKGFNQNGITDVQCLNYLDFFSSAQKKYHNYMSRLPFELRKGWERKYLKLINTKYIDFVKKKKPDLVFIYNDQMLLADTVREIKKTARVVFYLGDNPLYIAKRPFNLDGIKEGSHIFAPDTFWIEQLKLLGISNISHLIIGYNQSLNYKKELTEKEKSDYANDIVFIGRQYHDTWGYKRALFCSKFAGMDFKIYGDKIWLKWLEYFPELKPHFHLNEKYLSFEAVNTILNASKIYPVDANPGLINGLHLRIFECIGSGILPLVEYRKDLDIVFPDIPIPVIKNYNEAREISEYFISKEEERVLLIKNLCQFLDNNYTPAIGIEKIIKKVL